MADIPEVTDDEVAKLPEVSDAEVATGLPEVSDDDVAHSVGAASQQTPVPPLPQNTVEEDARRVKSATQKYLNQFITFGQDVSKYQAASESPSQSIAFKNASPLSSAFNVAGWALDKFQKHVGKHVAAGALKSAMSHEVPTSVADVIAPVDSLETQQFKQRWEQDIAKGGTALHDIRPTAKSKATPKEYMLRELLSTLGGDSIRLNEEEALPALNAMTQDTINIPGAGKIPVTAVMSSLVHEIGGLPLMVIGTGAGSRAVAAERAALREGALLAPKELASKLGKLELKSASIEGAVQGGIGAAKNNEDPGMGALMGAATGAALHGAVRGGQELYNFVGKALGGKAFTPVGPKGEALSQVNEGRDGLLLPKLTWEEYVKQADAVSERSQFKKVGTTEKWKPNEAFNKQLNVQGQQKPKFTPVGKGNEPYTYRTVKQDADGNLYEVRRVSNTKTGLVKDVYRAPIKFDTDSINALRDNMPINTDGEAYAALIDKIFPERWLGEIGEVKEVGEFPTGTPKITPQEAKPVAALTGESTRAERATPPRPVVAHADAEGNVMATPINGDVVDPTLLTPPKTAKGDIALLPDKQPVLVGDERGPTVAIRLKNGHEMVVEKSSLSKASEPYLADEDFKFNPKASNQERYIKPDKSIQERQLLELNRVTIPRTMKVMGMDLVEANDFLHTKVLKGELTTDGGGNFFVPEVKKTKYHEPEGVGFLTYYGTTPDGKGKIGVLRGRDPKNPNNYLLEIGDESSLPPLVDLENRQGPHTQEQYSKAEALKLQAQDVYPKTKTLSIPAEDVRSLKPVLWGNAKKSNLPTQHGIQTPLPPETVVTNQYVANQVADYTRKAGQLSKLLSTRKGVAQSLMNFISNEAFRVPTDIRQFSQHLASSPGVMKAQAQSYQETLSAQLGGELSATDTALSHVIKMNAAKRGGKPSQREQELMKFFNSNPQLSQEVQQTVDASLQRLKIAEQKLAMYGVPSIEKLEALRAAGVEEEYLMNVYLKYMLARKDWTQFVQKQLPDVWKEAVKRVSAMAPDEWSGQIEDRMLDVMGMDIQSETQKMKTLPNGDVKKNLKQRIEIHNEISKVIGKLDSASVQLAHSLAAAESLALRVESWNSIAATPYWSPGPRPDLGPHGGAVVPDLPIYGNARGGRVHESLQYLLEQKAPAKEGANMFRALSSYWKFNVVPAGGFAPWVNNVMRNWKGMILSGGLQSLTDLGTFFEAADYMLQKRGNSIMNVTPLDEAMVNGAVSTGFAGNEINKHKMASRVLNAIKKQQGKAKDLSDIVGAIPEALKGTAQDIGAAYDTIDRLFKLTSYLNIKRNYMSKGMTPDDAAAMATMRINQSFPNFELVSPTIERMRQGSISGIAPFLSSKAEDMRINALLIPRLAKEPDLAGRLIGAALTFAGMYKLMQEIRRANGITDADVNKALDADKLSSQAFRPMGAIGPEYDSEGRLQKWDFTPYEDMFITLQRHETDPLLGAIARNTMQGYFGGSGTLPGGLIDEYASTAFAVRPLSTQNPPTWRPGENGVLNFMSYLASHGAVPQMPLRMYEINARGAPTANAWGNATHEQWTPDQILWKQLGLPFANPIGKKIEAGRGLEAVKSVDELVKQMKQAPLSTTDKEHVKFLLDQKKKAAQGVVKEYNESKK